MPSAIKREQFCRKGTGFPVKKPTAGLIVCLLLCGALIAGVFYLIGYKTAYDRMENAVPPVYTSVMERG